MFLQSSARSLHRFSTLLLLQLDLQGLHSHLLLEHGLVAGELRDQLRDLLGCDSRHRSSQISPKPLPHVGADRLEVLPDVREDAL